jgi:hypothetical protein
VGHRHGWVDFCCGAREFGVMSESGNACYQKEGDDKKFEFPYQKDSSVLKYLLKPFGCNAAFIK